MTLLSLMLVSAACSRDEAGGEIELPEQAREIETVQADVRRGYEAFYGNDLDTILDLTHPVVIRGLGGRTKARQALGEAMDSIQAGGMRLHELTFPRPPRFVVGERNQFVMVPTRAIISKGGTSVESVNFWFGARRLGATEWKYLEGSRIDQGNIHQFFPDYPTSVEFPECSRRRL